MYTQRKLLSNQQANQNAKQTLMKWRAVFAFNKYGPQTCTVLALWTPFISVPASNWHTVDTQHMLVKELLRIISLGNLCPNCMWPPEAVECIRGRKQTEGDIPMQQ